MLSPPIQFWKDLLPEYERVLGKIPVSFLDQRLVSLFEDNGSFLAAYCFKQDCRDMVDSDWGEIRNPKAFMHCAFNIWKVKAWPSNT